MDVVRVVVQVVIALGILNVWMLRFNKATDWRGGGAQSMRDEFAVYGLPNWFMRVIGMLKVALATLLIAGIWIPELTKPAATGLALLMLGAIVMHVKVKDPLKRSVPAFCMLVLSAFLALG